MDRTESPDRLITTEKPDRFAPPEDPIELYKYDHVDERGTLRYYAGLLYFLYDNPTFLDGWKPWQRLKQFELLAILAAIVGLFFQIQATNEARQQFTEEMRFNREQWEEQRVSNAWALVAAATNPNDVGNIGAGFALETLNRKGESLKNISLPGANLIEADLEGAHLDGANLKGVALVAGNLKGAVLRHANLELADLRDANLEGASLIGANLDGAYLIGANLSGVPDLSCSQLQVASFWEHTYRDESLACGAEVPDPPPPTRANRIELNVTDAPAWRGFDAWLNRNPDRSADELTEHSGICHLCDALVDRMAHDDPVTRTVPWNQNLCPQCWAHRRPKGRQSRG